MCFGHVASHPASTRGRSCQRGGGLLFESASQSLSSILDSFSFLFNLYLACLDFPASLSSYFACASLPFSVLPYAALAALLSSVLLYAARADLDSALAFIIDLVSFPLSLAL